MPKHICPPPQYPALDIPPTPAGGSSNRPHCVRAHDKKTSLKSQRNPGYTDYHTSFNCILVLSLTMESLVTQVAKLKTAVWWFSVCDPSPHSITAVLLHPMPTVTTDETTSFSTVKSTAVATPRLQVATAFIIPDLVPGRINAYPLTPNRESSTTGANNAGLSRPQMALALSP